MSAPITASSHTHVGTLPPGYHQEWVTHTVHCHGFGSLPSVQDEFVDSPEFILLGNQWRLAIYPGGRANAEEGMVSLYLDNMSNKAIEIDYGFSVSDGNGKQVAYDRSSRTRNFGPVGADNNSRGFPNFATRLTLLSSLVNDTLIIKICMRLATPTKSVPPPFIPENPVAKMIQGVFLNDKYSDIMFEVGGEEDEDNAMKLPKTVPIKFHAHRVIVANSSTILSDLCESHNDETTPIQINDVTPDVFRLMLSYTYGGKISNDDMKLHAKEIIDAADKYGVVNLKLEAEASLVEGTTFTIKNVMELLLYAESKNCALLKEASMDYIVENKAEVIKKLSFTDTVPGTLMRDLLVAVSRGEMNIEGSDGDGGESQYNALRISELRKRAYENGLNVDGSREMLIAALEAAQVLGSEESNEVQ